MLLITDYITFKLAGILFDIDRGNVCMDTLPNTVCLGGNYKNPLGISYCSDGYGIYTTNSVRGKLIITLNPIWFSKLLLASAHVASNNSSSNNGGTNGTGTQPSYNLLNVPSHPWMNLSS
jgi:hypothetical protein